MQRYEIPFDFTQRVALMRGTETMTERNKQ